MPSEMALVRKPDSEGDFRQRKFSVTEQLLNVFDASLQQISVRRHPNRLPESPCEMVLRKPRHRGKSVQAYLLVQMRFNLFAYATCERG
jgi:hypothetical protein